MTDLSTIVFTQPIFESFTVQLAPSAGATPGRVARRRLETALRRTLDRSAKGWSVRRVGRSRGLEYDLLPPDDQSLTVDQAWEVSYALADLPDVVDAEPSFAVLQDTPPVEEPADHPEPAAALLAAAAAQPDTCDDDAAPVTVNPNQVDWSPRLIDAPCAWLVAPPPPPPGFAQGKSRGQGSRIGHPDSGYRLHPELFAEPPGQASRILTTLERDFRDDDHIALDEEGDHGLGTASVIMSSDMTGQIVGVAPAAELVPLRVTEPRFGIIPAPILFSSGMRALRDAIRYAVDVAGCHVISISLGWLPNESLHRAIGEAVAKNVIVCAAAGNYIGFVAWPAAYPEVIAVAGCNAQRLRWDGSSHGRKVDISGPAERVWRAYIDEQAVATHGQSNGTSYAVASVAGVAALWLAYHGRDFLISRYASEFTLTDVFRWVLERSSDSFSEPVGGQFGAGIVNARRVLTTPLPSLGDLRSALPAAEAAFLVAAPSATQQAIDAFDVAPPVQVRSRLAEVVQAPAAEVDDLLQGMEREMLFHLVTNPDLRNQLTRPMPGPEAAMAAAFPMAAPAEPAEVLADSPLSGRLRTRLSG